MISTEHLDWPEEAAQYPSQAVQAFAAPGSNLAMDFHGDPVTAGLVVYSDGNHHMALEESIRTFLQQNPDADDVFYTTTPPAPLVNAMRGEGLVLGNLRLSRKPDVFIGPDNILMDLHESGDVGQNRPFARSRGNVLLVRRGNPKNIHKLSDLLADDIAVTCSNPVTEKASFSVYRQALVSMAESDGLDGDPLITRFTDSGPQTVHSKRIHHREVPEIVASGQADVAVIYYHLALRYVRIFPEIFDLVDIDEVTSDQPNPRHPTTTYHVGLVNDENPWAAKFFDFMQGGSVADIYHRHGLVGFYQ